MMVLEFTLKHIHKDCWYVNHKY